MSVTVAVLGEISWGHAASVPYSPLYDDLYHAAGGAWGQAEHVFLHGNGLPERWQGRQRFVILETGFGLGNNFLATWSAWRRDAMRCERLVFISIEKHPLCRADLARVHGLIGEFDVAVDGGASLGDDRHALASRLVDAWPALTPGLHTLHFDDAGAVPRASKAMGGERVTLMLGLGDIADLLPSLIARVDAFYLDGFSPAKNPQMWSEHLLSRLNRLAAPVCTAATWSAARAARDALTQAGFHVARVAGFADKRDMLSAVYEPHYVAPSPAGGIWPAPTDQADHHAIVLGAGLAGCSAALALCREGWRVTLIDQHEGPANEASGNAGGLFHSVLHGDDGVHARAHRAAALATWRQARAWIESGRVRGQADGLLRLDAKANHDMADALLARQCLPADHVQWLDQAQAQAKSGLAVESGAWLYHQAGWLHPAGLAQAMLDEAAAFHQDGRPLLTCLWRQQASAIRQDHDGLWRVWAGEKVIAQAPSLVLCNAHQVPALLASLPGEQAVAPLPLSATRGQVTEFNVNVAQTQTQKQTQRLDAMPCPHLPVAGAGYVIPLSGNTLLCGATTQADDFDPTVREADHRHNLAQAARLGVCIAMEPNEALPEGLRGRTAWRAVTPDRLPMVGALPWSAQRLNEAAAKRGRRDQVRLIARQRGERGGLYTLTGLGSRGITWSFLSGELLAHWVTGGPCPVEADLRDALDPARFLVRQVTKGG